MNTLFGTDGIRGRVGTGWLSAEKLSVLGKAIGLWALQRYGHNPHVLLLHDTRESCGWIKEILVQQLIWCSNNVIDAHILPTPAAWHIMQDMPKCDYALVISASHNLYTDNGIKIIDRLSGKLSTIDEQTIQNLLHTQCTTTYAHGNVAVLQQSEQYYIQSLLRHFTPQCLKGIKVVLDVAHGATYHSAQQLFSLLKAETIVINNTPNGRNINDTCGSTQPAHLQRTVIEAQADIGFAFDGDGDRVLAVNRHGCIKDGDDILALLLDHPAYQTTSAVVGTIMSNQGLEHYLSRRGKLLQRTPVGDKYVAEKLLHEQLILGGEPSGHIILHDLITTGDGILVALRLLETVISTGNWDMETFVKYPQIIINVPCAQPRNLDKEPFNHLIAQAHKELRQGRLIVRFSGTV